MKILINGDEYEYSKKTITIDDVKELLGRFVNSCIYNAGECSHCGSRVSKMMSAGKEYEVTEGVYIDAVRMR